MNYSRSFFVRIFLAVLAVTLAGMELRWPPVKSTNWISEWGGKYHTSHSRRGLESFAADWLVDHKVQALEIIMVGFVLLAALVPFGAGKTVKVTRLAGVSLLFHAGTCMLPLAVAGGDTIWVAANPIQLLFCLFLFIPQIVLIVASIQMAGHCADSDTPLNTGGLATKDWVYILAFIAAIMLTCASFSTLPLFILSPFGIGFVATAPLSGTWSAAIAMWLTLASLQAFRSAR
jgi:hypothetical protein